MSRAKLPDAIRRVVLFARVKPSTKKFIETIPEMNDGRALDRMVESLCSVREAIKVAHQIRRIQP